MQALYRTRMKDGLIILQGLVLAVCIAAILLRKRHLVRNKKSKHTRDKSALLGLVEFDGTKLRM